MANLGKCPGCSKVVRRANVEHIEISQTAEKSWHGVSYVCPNANCRIVLGVGLDPVSLGADLARQIAKTMK